MVALDSWALLAYLKGEPASERIGAAWSAQGAAISSINLGEVLYVRARQEGAAAALSAVETIRRLLDVVDPDWPLVEAAARIKAGGGLAYADAFCIATAVRVGAPLWTGDPEILALAPRHRCEVVDLRS